MTDVSGDEAEDLLRILNAHGQQFLSSFDSSVLPLKRRSQDSSAAKSKKCGRQAEELPDEDDGSCEEWAGFSDYDGDENEDGSTAGGNDGTVLVCLSSSLCILTEHESRRFPETCSRKPDVVVFSEHTSRSSSVDIATIKAQKKAFMVCVTGTKAYVFVRSYALSPLK